MLTLAMGLPLGATADMMLADCLKYGFENNPSLKAADYGVAASEENRKSVRGDFLPSLSTSYTYNQLGSINSKGPTDTDYLDQATRNFSLRISQVLYAGSRLVNTYDKAKIEKEKQLADKALAKLELAYRMEATFFQLMGAKQDVTVGLESVNRLEEGVKSANAHFEKQLISYAEVLTAEVDLANAEQQLSISKNNVNRKRVALFSLMNMPVDEAIEFSGGMDFFPKAYEREFESCWQIAIKNRPDLDSLEQRVLLSEKDASIALGSYLPTVRLEGGYADQNKAYDKYSSSDQRNRYWNAGVTASWDLFDGGRAWYRSRQSNITVSQIKEMIKETQLFIKEGIRKALFSIAEADQRAVGALRAVKAAEENYEVEKHRMEAGLTTIPLLLDAQIRLTRAQSNYIQAMLDYMLGRSELQFMMGEPLVLAEN
jgi:outer membrane protein